MAGTSRSSRSKKVSHSQDDMEASSMDTDNNEVLDAIKSMENRISQNINNLENTIADRVAASVREQMDIVRAEFKSDIDDLIARVSSLEQSYDRVVNPVTLADECEWPGYPT